MQPTIEQTRAVELFRTGAGLAIEAGAGTGKTSTLELIARSTGDHGTYVAFNRSIVEEAKRRMPGNVRAATAHSLAMRAVGSRYRHRLDGGRIRSDEVARRLGLGHMVVTYDGTRKVLQPGYLAGLVMRTVQRFCFSADDAPGKRHVPFIAGIDPPDSAGRRGTANNELVRDHVVGAIAKAWADLSDPAGDLRFTHDCYLKLWQLREPKIAGSFLLFDEAQDAAPVMLAAVTAQGDKQIVYVGDSCQPPGTMVRVVWGDQAGRGRRSLTAEVPIEEVKPGELVLAYDIERSHLHRRGRQVLGVSSRQVVCDLVRVKAGPALSRYTPDHHCVVKVGDAMADKHLVYLMRRGASFRIGRAAGRYGAAFGPMLRAQAEGADALWILSAHDTAEAAGIAEATMAARYGIPMMLFAAAANRLMSENGIHAFWLGMGDLTDKASALLTRHQRDIRWPLWEAGTDRLLIRRARVMRACNVMDGMYVRDAEDGWVPVTIERERYNGPVYSMTVEGLHTYVGDGIVTHNCQQIYEWRGAVNALASVDADEVAYLSESFRFGPPVAALANGILGRLGAELRLKGRGGPSEVISRGHLEDPDAVLTRSNAEAVSTVLRLQAEGRRPHLIGGGDEVVRFARAAQELKDGESTYHPELACFDSWDEVKAYCLAPHTRVLRKDLRWAPIADLEVGDELVGFDEENVPGNGGRRFRTVMVESHRTITRPCHRIWFGNGVDVVASDEHRWLVPSGNCLRWKMTKTLRPGDRIISMGAPWVEEQTREAGWLAGIFDGEGCLVGGDGVRSRSVSMAQKDGPVLERARQLLKARGFDFAEHDKPGGSARDLILKGGLADRLRFLAEIRPERLVAQAEKLWEGRRVERLEEATVLKVKPCIGEREVVAMGTSAGTFIAEGLLSHNCQDDPQGDELKLLVDLVEEYTVPTILQALEQMPDERLADVAVSTAHKAKGREWRKVRLAPDFQEPEGNDGEWRLLYVAATRAREVLDVTACDPLRDLATSPTLDMLGATVTDRLADAFPDEPEIPLTERPGVFVCGRSR